MQVLAQRRAEAARSRQNDLRPRRDHRASGVENHADSSASNIPAENNRPEDQELPSADDSIAYSIATTPKNPLLRLVKPGTPFTGPVYTRAKPMRATSELKSRRHIPMLSITAIGMPFLRFGKPQPPWIDLMLRARLKRRELYADSILSLEEEFCEDAENEDNWEILVRLMRRQAGKLTDEDNEDVRYVDAVDDAKEETMLAWSADTLDMAAQAHAMAKIVEEERKARDDEDKQGWFYPPVMDAVVDASSFDAVFQHAVEQEKSSVRKGNYPSVAFRK